MREVDLLVHFEVAPLPDRSRRRRPFPHPVHGKHHGFFKWRRKERARRVAEMVLAEEQLLVPAVAALEFPQSVLQQAFTEELSPQPQGHRHAKRLEPAWRKRQIRLDQPLKLQERLVVEDDAIHAAQPGAALGQAVADRVGGKPGIVLLAREAFLLRRSNDLAVLDQCRSAVMVKRGNPENAQVPALSEQRVYERRNGRALRQHDQHTQKGHHYEDRPQPVFLSAAHERPQLLEHFHSDSLKLVGHGIRWRPGRLARYPVRVRAGIELQAQRVLPRESRQDTDRSDDAIKRNAQCNRTHDLPQQKSELEPQPIRYGKERWLPDGDYGENNCYT